MTLEELKELLTRGYRSEEAIIRLLEKTPDLLNEEFNTGETLLHTAAQYKCAILVYYLMNKKPDPEFWFKATRGFSAVDIAIMKHDTYVIAVMIGVMTRYNTPEMTKKVETLKKICENFFSKASWNADLNLKLTDSTFLPSYHQRMHEAIDGGTLETIMYSVSSSIFSTMQGISGGVSSTESNVNNTDSHDEAPSTHKKNV